MRTMTRFLTCALALGMLVGVAAPVQAKDLPSDSRILQGKLDNGVTWLYRQHDQPPGRMWLMIHVDAGSLHETDEQQGLAHFMEHMSFNGTENFAPGELIPYFESIGMEFGPDINARTGFDQTAYMVFAPDTTVPQIDKALMVLSDYAFRNLLLAEEIENERGVILEEARTGKGPFQRIRDELWPELFEGSRFARRLIIGKEEVFMHAPRAQFEDFYRTWYRPENVTLVMVGDAPMDAYLPSIKKWFGQYRPTFPARDQKGPEFKPFTGQRSIVVTDPELSDCSVQMLNIRPGRPATVTVEQWRTDLVEYMAGWIVDRRYEELVNKGEASFLGAGTAVFDFFGDALLVFGRASGEPADWAKMLEQMVLEVSRARAHGFTEYEVQLAKKELLAEAERAVKTEPSRDARSIIEEIISAVNDKTPVLSAQQELDLYKALLPSVTLDELNASFRAHFAPGTFAFVVQTPEKEGVQIPSRDEVIAAARAAWARKVEPFSVEEAPTELLAALPTPGEVVEKTFDEDLGITDVWLSNGVRVHHRFMDYKKDRILINIALAGGPIEETAENAGVSRLASLVVNEAATSRLTSTQMRDLMTGKNIRVGAGEDRGTLNISINGSPEDLEIGLQKAHALMTDGKLEEAAFKNLKLEALQRIEFMEKLVQAQAIQALYDLLTGSDPRRPFRFLKKENIEALSIPQGQAWFDRLCREAPIEVTVVGDMKYEDIMPLIERYIGSLPKRSRSAAHLDKLRKRNRREGPLTAHVEVETVTPQAIAFAGFVSAEAENIFDVRALDIATNILSSRLIKRVREELAIVYSIGARHQPNWTYKDSGIFLTGAPCDAPNTQKLIDEVNALYQAFAEDGPTAEELQNAKKQIANDLDDALLEPDYWLGVLMHFDLYGRRLEDEKNKKEKYDRFTGEQVKNVFSKYFKPERQFSAAGVPVAPKPAEAPEQVEEKKEPATAAP